MVTGLELVEHVDWNVDAPSAARQNVTGSGGDSWLTLNEASRGVDLLAQLFDRAKLQLYGCCISKLNG
ncbi:hypothetical protein D3C85_1852940 [compost metagenome]